MATQSTKNELEYELKVVNPETSFGDGFISEFEWHIGDRKIVQKADPANLEASSKINYTFSSYGANDVSVLLKDDSGKVKEIKTVVNIQKNMVLKSHLRVFDNGEEITNMRYDEKNHEYYIDNLGIPTTLKLDARLVRPEDLIYSLKEVSWNLDNNNTIDGTGKTIDYDVPIEGNHTVAVTYTFQHRKIPTDIVKLTEHIYIE